MSIKWLCDECQARKPLQVTGDTPTVRSECIRCAKETTFSRSSAEPTTPTTPRNAAAAAGGNPFAAVAATARPATPTEAASPKRTPFPFAPTAKPATPTEAAAAPGGNPFAAAAATRSPFGFVEATAKPATPTEAAAPTAKPATQAAAVTARPATPTEAASPKRTPFPFAPTAKPATPTEAAAAPGGNPFAVAAAAATVGPLQVINSFPTFNLNEITIDERNLLGRGSCDVYGGTLVATGEPVAVKVLKFPTTPDLLPAVQNELQTLAFVGTGASPYVVRLRGCALDAASSKILVAMERASNGSLDAEVAKLRGRLPDLRRVATIMLQVALGLKFLHGPHGSDNKSVLHLDLKFSQVLLFDSGMTAKLCDFGISTTTLSTLTVHSGNEGTPAFKAPEQFSKQRRKGPFTDVYGLGGMLWSWLRGGELPWTNYNPEEISTALVLEKDSLVSACGAGFPGLKPAEQLPATATDAHVQLATLAADCLSNDHVLRPQLCEVIARLTAVAMSLAH